MHHRLALFVAALCSLPGLAFAANQGSLGSTSTGSLTLTAQGPALPRQVQVTGLSDPIFTNSDRSEFDGTKPGFTMLFCVVDTYSGALSLNVASAGGPQANGWRLVSSGGQSVVYRAVFKAANSPTLLGDSWSAGTSFSFSIPIGISVADAAACGTGNMKANFVLINGDMPQTLPAVSYTDTLTFVLSPQ